jgi:ribosomal protein L44E
MISLYHVNQRELKKTHADVRLYIGRTFKPFYGDLVDAKLGNHHPVGFRCSVCGREHSRQEAIRLYERDVELMAPNHPVKRRLRRLGELLLEGKTIALFCHCGTYGCHGHVIQRWAAWYHRELKKQKEENNE